MLKLFKSLDLIPAIDAAAFGRLCVETMQFKTAIDKNQAAAFGRLCVETVLIMSDNNLLWAAAFGRLCVETIFSSRISLL